MGPISTLPNGLLSLFGIKNSGKMPKELAEFIQPTFDITQLLLRTNVETLYFESIFPANSTLPGNANTSWDNSNDYPLSEREYWLVTRWQTNWYIPPSSSEMADIILGCTGKGARGFQAFPEQSYIRSQGPYASGVNDNRYFGAAANDRDIISSVSYTPFLITPRTGIILFMPANAISVDVGFDAVAYAEMDLIRLQI